MQGIDINCDMGESYGNYSIGHDVDIFPYITSCNIACGYHAGDPLNMELTIRRALEHGVQIGAHPGYPDLQGFGRRAMKIKSEDLKAMIKYQIAALKGMVESHGGVMKYVKPHGALYNASAGDVVIAAPVIQALREIDPTLMLMGLAGSQIEHWALEAGISFIPEAFADRRYEDDGSLRSRSLDGAVIQNPLKAAEQVLSLARDGQVRSFGDNQVSIKARSICIHGDNPQAVEILSAIDLVLEQNDIVKIPF